MQVERWPTHSKGRSRTVTYGGVIWTVANASDTSVDFEEQTTQSLRMLESHLIEAGSARSHILSIQVILADISRRSAFDDLWREWIGPDAQHWPQRACFQSSLAPGLLIELVVMAAPASAIQVAHLPES